LQDLKIKDSDDETSNADIIDLVQQKADDDRKWMENWIIRRKEKLDSKVTKIETQKQNLVASWR